MSFIITTSIILAFNLLIIAHIIVIRSLIGTYKERKSLKELEKLLGTAAALHNKNEADIFVADPNKETLQ